jgi:isochorismate synthase
VTNCKNTSLQKAVAARMVPKKIDKNFRLEEMFIHLLQAHPLAMVNLFYHYKAGLWLGASPELLVRSNGNKFETVALAGTKLNTENRAFTAKEIEEQDIVKQYIVTLLAAENIKADAAADAETVIAGNVAHLQTKIAFQTDKTVLELAKILHPTPAVCGFPKEEAQAMIRKYEGNQRQLYAGYIGVVNAQQQALYVHLRCMQVLENELIIHVGAGITKDSDAAKEWQETENKAQTLLRWVD